MAHSVFDGSSNFTCEWISLHIELMSFEQPLRKSLNATPMRQRARTVPETMVNSAMGGLGGEKSRFRVEVAGFYEN